MKPNSIIKKIIKTSMLFGVLLVSFPASTQTIDSAEVIRQVDSLVDIVITLRKQRNFDKALEVSTAAENLALKKLGAQSAAYAKCCFYHGRIVSSMGDLPETEKWFLKAKNIRESTLGKDHPDYAWSLNYLGDLYQRMGNLEKAEYFFTEAMNTGEKVFGKNDFNYAIILDNTGYLYQYMGAFEKAEVLCLEANRIFEKTKGTQNADYAISSNILYNLYLNLAQFEKAEEYIMKTLASWESVSGKESARYGQSLDNLAILHFTRGNYEKAEAIYYEAIATFEKSPGKESEDYIQCSFNLWNLLQLLGNYEKAEPILVELRDLQEKVHGRESLQYSGSLRDLGILYHHMGQYEKAERLYREAYALREKVQNDERDLAMFLEDLALLYLDMGNFEKAEPLFVQVMAKVELEPVKNYTRFVKHYVNQARFYHAIGQYEKAEQYYLEADTLRENVYGRGLDPNYANSLIGMANLYKDMGHDDKAASLFEEQAYLQQSLIRNATRHMSQRELLSYINSYSNRLAHMLSFVETTPGQGARIYPACYDNILFYKGFLLNASERMKRLAFSDPVAAEKYHVLKSYERRLSTEYTKPTNERKNITELQAKVNDLEKELAIDITSYDDGSPQLRWQDVQQKLQSGEAAVEFIRYEYYDTRKTDSIMYAALVVHPDDAMPQFVPLFEEQEIVPLIKGAKSGNFQKINALYSGLVKSVDQESLYDLIWKPLEAQLKDVNKIYCSPAGLLHRINLGAIVVHDKEIFGDRRQLVTLNSTRQIAIPTTIHTNDHDAYIAGGVRYDMDSSTIDDVYALYATRGMTTPDEITFQEELSFKTDSASRGGHWNYLPQTASEALDIHDVFLASHISTQLDTGYFATEESFRSLGLNEPSPRILHVATHGFFFPDPKETVHSRQAAVGSEPVFKISEHPMIRSGLILAGAQQAWTTGKAPEHREDGILTAYEISQMNLSSTELVVLSACETGLGQVEGNEGVYGLQRAFKIAGAKYLIMSLWKVNDQSTRELMTDFYKQWLINKRSIPEAFRAAQQNMKEKYADSPYHWAGFVLVE